MAQSVTILPGRGRAESKAAPQAASSIAQPKHDTPGSLLRGAPLPSWSIGFCSSCHDENERPRGIDDMFAIVGRSKRGRNTELCSCHASTDVVL